MSRHNRYDKKREKRNRVLMSVFLSIIMIMSAFSIYLSSTQNNNKIKEYGHTFSIDSQSRTYYSDFNGNKINFYFLPSEVKNINSDPLAAGYVKGAKAIALTFNPNSINSVNLQVIDLLRFDFSNYLGKVAISAVTNTSNLYSSLPVITCENATIDYPVINFVESNEPSIITNGPCIIVAGNTTGFLQARDRFFYDYFGLYEEG